MPTESQTAELVFDGPLTPLVMSVLGVVLFGMFCGLLYRERHILGRQTAWLFLILRATAVVIVAWMLLAPTRLITTRETTPQAVAVLTDVSQSMQTIDEDAYQSARWAPKNDSATELISLADRAEVAATMAEQRLRNALAADESQVPIDQTMQSISAAVRALQRLRQHLHALESGNAASQQTQNAIAEIRTLTSGRMFDAITEASTRHQNGQAVDSRSWKLHLPDLAHRMNIVSSEVRDLTANIEQQVKNALNESDIKRGFVSLRPQADNPSNRANTAKMDKEKSRHEIVADYFNRWTATHAASDSPWNFAHYEFDSSTRARRIRSEEVPESEVPESEVPESDERLATDMTGAFRKIEEISRESDASIAAVIVVGDMGHNGPNESNESNGDPVDAARRLGLPVFALPIGNPRHVRDAEVTRVSAPSVVMKGDRVALEATVRAHRCEGETLTVQLLEGDKIVLSRDVAATSETSSHRVRLDIPAETLGPHSYAVRIQDVEDELTTQNNLRETQVYVADDSMRVLLCDERARWEHRYLYQLFRRDSQVRQDELVFQPEVLGSGKLAETGSLPITVDGWGEYDVVILGDLPTSRLSVAAQLALTEYIQQRGGTLIVIAGSEAMPSAYGNQPIQALLPVQAADSGAGPGRLGPFSVRVSSDGWRHQTLLIGDDRAATNEAFEFMNTNSPLEWISNFHRPRPSAHALLEAHPSKIPSAFPGVPPSQDPQTNQPANAATLLAWHQAGRGRVVFLASPEMYRLRYLRGDRLHHRFWGQLLRWAVAADLAAGNDRLRIRTERSYCFTDEPLRITVQAADAEGDPVRDATMMAKAIQSDGSERLIPLVTNDESPGEYWGEVSRLAEGECRICPAGKFVESLELEELPETKVLVRKRLPQELLDTRCNLALAGQIATASGGQVIRPTSLNEVLELTDWSPIVKETRQSVPLWPRWHWLIAVFVCFQLEWTIRKTRGFS